MSQKESYPCNRTYKGKYTQSVGDSILTIVHNNPVYSRLKFPECKEPGIVNGYLKKLKIFCDVPNLPMAEVPDIDITATRTEAYALQKQVEWHSPGFGILIWSSKHPNPSPSPSIGDWTLIGYHSVINTGVWRQYDSYPLFSNNLTDELEEGDRIGISLVSRWNNGVEYFARLSPPYSMPENRPDQISIEASWVQDLVVAKKDAQPIFLTVYSTTSSGGTQVQTKPPTVVITANGQPISGDLYTIDKTPMTLTVGQLTPNGQFSYQWYLAGSAIGTVATDNADANGNKTFNFDSAAFTAPPFTGTGSYSLRVTNGALSTDSNAITIKHYKPRSRLNPIFASSAASGTGTTWVCYLFDYKDNIPVTLTMMKNGVDLAGWSYTGTPIFYSGEVPSPWQLTGIPSNIFYQSGWGVGTGELYQIKATSNGVVSISDTFTVNQYYASSKG